MSRLQNKLRELLRAAPEGLTTADMADKGQRRSVVTDALHKMPDAYIDRWDGNEAIWCIVTPPPHCPHPTGRYGYK